CVLLAEAGWPRALAAELVARMVEDAAPGQVGSIEQSGWRTLAAELGLPPWQVRRVMVVLFGAPGWPGLLERLLLDEDVRGDLALRAAVISTRRKSRRSPALEAARARSDADRDNPSAGRERLARAS
ncbi:MAG TPA: hypothetical protein VN257_04860, partial [Actinotalea sp.]|nr:hypothetical protein [Actinotalea sp.]